MASLTTSDDHKSGPVLRRDGSLPQLAVFVPSEDDGTLIIPPHPEFKGLPPLLKLYAPEPDDVTRDRNVIEFLVSPTATTGTSGQDVVLDDARAMGFAFEPSATPFGIIPIESTFTCKFSVLKSFIKIVHDSGNDNVTTEAVAFLAETGSWKETDFGTYSPLENGVQVHGANFLRVVNECLHRDSEALKADFDAICRDISRGLDGFTGRTQIGCRVSLIALDKSSRGISGGVTDSITGFAASGIAAFFLTPPSASIPIKFLAGAACVAVGIGYAILHNYFRGGLAAIAKRYPSAQIALDPA